MVEEFISNCGKYKIVIDYDDFCDSPEKEDCIFEGFNFIVRSNNNNFYPDNTYDLEDFEEYDDEKDEYIPIFENLEKNFGKGNVFNLYAHIHSSIHLSLNTNVCICPWDSGQLGFLVFDSDKNTCLDDDFKNDPEKIKELAISYIDCYNKYINGGPLMYNIYIREPLFNERGEEVTETWDPISGCCGYYEEKDCMESAFDDMLSINKNIKFDCQEYKEYIKNKTDKYESK